MMDLNPFLDIKLHRSKHQSFHKGSPPITLISRGSLTNSDRDCTNYLASSKVSSFDCGPHCQDLHILHLRRHLLVMTISQKRGLPVCKKSFSSLIKLLLIISRFHPAFYTAPSSVKVPIAWNPRSRYSKRHSRPHGHKYRRLVISLFWSASF